MKFLFPTFLFALFAVAIPLIIHLFSFKRFKTVYFSNVGFLKDIKKESKKKSRLKQLLILIARILTIVSLVFAFSQPYIPTSKEQGNSSNKLVGIYIDNSFSMNALSENGQLLELARNKAAEICMAYPAGTNFQLFTNDLDPRHNHTFNKEQFIQQISEIKPSPVVLPVSKVINRFTLQNSDENQKTEKLIYLISDFQKTISDFNAISNKNISCYCIPLKPNNITNIYIDSCWVEIPAHRLKQEETVFVRIKNSSDQHFQNLPLKLTLNDSVKSITNFSVEAHNQIIAQLNYTNNSSGLQLGKVEITDYPFTHDNNWYISYFVKPAINTLAIYNSETNNEGLDYLNALFADDSFVLLDKMSLLGLQVSKLAQYNTLFLIHPANFTSGFLDQIEKVVANGASVVLFPDISGNVMRNNSFLSKFNASLVTGIDTLSQKISGIDFNNRFFENVFRKKEKNAVYPEIKSHLLFENNTRSPETKLLWFQNSDKALSVFNYKKGKVWVFSFPINQSNSSFTHDILFVPTVYNIVLNSLPSQKISYMVGRNNIYQLPSGTLPDLNKNIEVENLSDKSSFLPDKKIVNRNISLDFSGHIINDGHYLVRSGAQTIASLSYNYNRNESELSYFSMNELNEQLKLHQLKNTVVLSDINRNFSEILDEINNGKQLWKLFIFLALFFILSETIISRFLK